VPTTAQAYSFNITVIPHGALGYLSAWPTGSPQPLVATVNSRASSGFSDGLGPPSLVADGTRSFPVQSSSCEVPSSAEAYSMRMTVVAPAPLGYITAWPVGQPLPLVATLNAPNGGVIGNQAIVPAGTAGAIDVFASGNTDLVIDLNGYFAAPGSGGLHFYTLPPCRVADTRSGSAGSGITGAFGPPSLVAGATRDFPMPTSFCGIPSTAQAYSLNLTVVAPEPLGYLTAWPTGQPFPLASTLNANASTGGTVSAGAIVPAGTDGAISVFALNTTDLVIDINGYFAP
jgi:hypothetical protein